MWSVSTDTAAPEDNRMVNLLWEAMTAVYTDGQIVTGNVDCQY
jgi:hypothetical protein